MVLNNEAFAKVREITGYEHAQYVGVMDGMMIFLTYDGSHMEPTRGAYALVREDFTVASIDDVICLTPNGHHTLPR